MHLLAGNILGEREGAKPSRILCEREGAKPSRMWLRSLETKRHEP